MIDAVTSEVLSVLRWKRFLVNDEAELQRLVAAAFDDAGLVYQREKRFGERDRVDFMIGGTALELKVKSPEKALLRQLLRYAEHDSVRAIIVAGTCHSVLRLPREAHGKTVYPVHLKAW